MIHDGLIHDRRHLRGLRRLRGNADGPLPGHGRLPDRPDGPCRRGVPAAAGLDVRPIRRLAAHGTRPRFGRRPRGERSRRRSPRHPVKHVAPGHAGAPRTGAPESQPRRRRTAGRTRIRRARGRDRIPGAAHGRGLRVGRRRRAVRRGTAADGPPEPIRRRVPGRATPRGLPNRNRTGPADATRVPWEADVKRIPRAVQEASPAAAVPPQAWHRGTRRGRPRDHASCRVRTWWGSKGTAGRNAAGRVDEPAGQAHVRRLHAGRDCNILQRPVSWQMPPVEAITT